MLSIEQTDAAIRETFYSMEEEVEYVLSDFWHAEANRVRKEYGYSIFKDKREFIFSRSGDKLFLNKNEVFRFKDKTNLSLAFALTFALTFTFAFALTFAFAFSLAFTLALSLALALQHNGIEKLNTGCEGKIVEIDGKKYKLTAV